MTDGSQIEGVQIHALEVHGDSRGRVIEGWRCEWTDWQPKQLTEGRAAAGVIKGLHLHYRQFDLWRCIVGRMQIGLYDARPSSPTAGQSLLFEIDDRSPCAVEIPPGVAHGFYALADVEMIYLLSELYDPSDEFGIRYDSVGLDWTVNGGLPLLLSDRDAGLPTREQFVWEEK